MHRIAPLLLAMLFAAARLGGQTPSPPQLPPRAMPAPTPMAKGTGTVRGTVVTSVDGQPVAGATVRLTMSPPLPPTGPFMPFIATATTDGSGRFELTEVPAGMGRVSAERNGFYNTADGDDAAARAAGESSRVRMTEGHVVNDVQVRLSRAGIIAGRVLNPSGDPAERVFVEVLRKGVTPMGARLMPANRLGPPPGTDDTGAFRIFGLAAGDYVLSARVNNPMMPNAITTGSRDGFATTYYPGTTRLEDAKVVSVRDGSETTGLVFTMSAAKLASIRGSVAVPDGVDTSNVRLGITVVESGRMGGMMMGTRLDADGKFTYSQLAPGRYRLTAQDQMGMGARFFDDEVVDVDGRDVEGVTLALRSGTRVTGRIVTTSGEPVPGTSAMRVQFSRPDMDMMVPSQGPQPVGPDGRFTLDGLFARSFVRLINTRSITEGPAPGSALYTGPDGWPLVAVRRGDRDVTDTGIEPTGEPVEVTLVVSPKPSEVKGTVNFTKSPDGEPPAVVVFTEDSARWQPLSLAVRRVAVGTDGRFVMKGLPPGDRYLAVAVERLAQTDLWAEGMLQTLRGAATPIRIEDGGVLELTLTAIPRPR